MPRIPVGLQQRLILGGFVPAGVEPQQQAIAHFQQAPVVPTQRPRNQKPAFLVDRYLAAQAVGARQHDPALPGLHERVGQIQAQLARRHLNAHMPGADRREGSLRRQVRPLRGATGDVREREAPLGVQRQHQFASPALGDHATISRHPSGKQLAPLLHEQRRQSLVPDADIAKCMHSPEAPVRVLLHRDVSHRIGAGPKKRVRKQSLSGLGRQHHVAEAPHLSGEEVVRLDQDARDAAGLARGIDNLVREAILVGLQIRRREPVRKRRGHGHHHRVIARGPFGEEDIQGDKPGALEPQLPHHPSVDLAGKGGLAPEVQRQLSTIDEFERLFVQEHHGEVRGALIRSTARQAGSSVITQVLEGTDHEAAWSHGIEPLQAQCDAKRAPRHPDRKPPRGEELSEPLPQFASPSPLGDDIRDSWLSKKPGAFAPGSKG